jgi:uncharacterized protein (UPF0332 family)
MKIDPIITKRFEELIAAGQSVLATKRTIQVMGAPSYVDTQMAEQWGTSCISFIARTLGQESEHFARLKKHSEKIIQHHYSELAQAVLQSAYEEYKGGYLFDARRRIQAELFDDFLEQAEHFSSDGYFGVAAVIAGAVLEDTLRKLCGQKGIILSSVPKLDAMNAELAKQGAYDKLIQKKVTWLADIRNKAAHGKWDEFTNKDADEMVRATRRFTEEYAR